MKKTGRPQRVHKMTKAAVGRSYNHLLISGNSLGYLIAEVGEWELPD